MRDFSALPYPARPLGRRAEGREKFRLMRERPRPNRGSELLIAMGVIALFVLCGAVYFCSGLLSTDRYHDGVFINGVPMGGSTQAEAVSRFEALKGRAPAPIRVSAAGKTWTITAQDIAARYNVDETLGRAWLVGREGGAFQRLGVILSLRMHPKNLQTSVVYDSEKLKGFAEKIAREASAPERNAALQFLPATQDIFTVTEGTDGSAVDANRLYSLLQQQFLTGGSSVSVQANAVKPKVTAALLHSQTQLLASFTTALTADAVRNNNISLAGQAVNGAVLYPGEEFSFNALTGERSKARGYVDAPAIMSGKLVDAPGGGVCQVATTVYNAALLAGLDVVERHHHTWKMSYVDAGLDATVDWPSKKDLRLKNNTGTPVYLVLRVDEKNLRVTANFYGLPPREAITVSPTVLEKKMPGEPAKVNNPNAAIGTNTVLEETIPGYRVDVYRVYSDGVQTRRELVSEDVYEPVAGKIEIGTKAPAGGK